MIAHRFKLLSKDVFYSRSRVPLKKGLKNSAYALSTITLLCGLTFNALADTTITDRPIDTGAIVAVKLEGAKDFCSGVVISKNEVLTAAHCIYDLQKHTFHPATSIKIGLGENLIHENFTWLEVDRILEKPSKPIHSTEDYLANDIVRLRVNKLSPSITPLTLANDNHPSTTLSAWGFGEDEWGYYGTKKIRALEDVSWDGPLISFSAGACRGDSGGPIVDELNRVVGIISMSTIQHCVTPGKRLGQRTDFRSP